MNVVESVPVVRNINISICYTRHEMRLHIEYYDDVHAETVSLVFDPEAYFTDPAIAQACLSVKN